MTSALSRHAIELPAEQVESLDRYRALLWERNKVLNLTRHTDFERFVTRDVVDSLRLAELLEPNERVLDMGTGGGVPGVILAIVRPDLHVELAESVAKRALAVHDIVAELGIAISVHHRRAEELVAQQRYNTIVARAVAPLDKMLRWLKPCWNSIGRLLLIKGPRWTEERGAARHQGQLDSLSLRKLAEYATPGSGAQNVILAVWQKK